jgi:hypothetical protein
VSRSAASRILTLVAPTERLSHASRILQQWAQNEFQRCRCRTEIKAAGRPCQLSFGAGFEIQAVPLRSHALSRW